MKYRELLERLRRLSDEQLNGDLTVETPDGELVPGTIEIWSDEDDRLDDGHPVITCYLDVM